MSTRKAHAWRQAAFAGRPPGSHFPTPKEGVANQKCHTQQGLLEGTHAVDVSIYIYIQIYRYIYIGKFNQALAARKFHEPFANPVAVPMAGLQKRLLEPMEFQQG